MGKGSLWRSTADASELAATAFKRMILGWGIDIVLEVQPRLDFEVFTNVQASGRFSATAFASGMSEDHFLYLKRRGSNVCFRRRTLGESPSTKRSEPPIFGVTASQFFSSCILFCLGCLCFVFVLCLSFLGFVLSLSSLGLMTKTDKDRQRKSKKDKDRDKDMPLSI